MGLGQSARRSEPLWTLAGISNSSSYRSALRIYDLGSIMRNKFQKLVDTGEVTIIETIEVAPRPERRLRVPESFREGPIGEWITASGVGSGGSLWRHQSLALEAIDRGSNIVVATGTASGKSLVFQLAVVRELLQGDGKAIILYPLKALLSDQLNRWRRVAKELGFPESVVAELHG